MRVVALAGGTGAAKLVRGLAASLAPADLAVVVNTGDDCEVAGLHVSPDLDTITYALAGRLDRERGWGLEGETFACLEALGDHGVPTWFRLGDRDLATHIVRTAALGRGMPLSEATAAIARRLGVAHTVLPMCDDRVRTRLLGPTGWLDFQEYFVREGTRVDVRAVAYAGAAAARPAPGVAAAIAAAGLVVICPSNPVTSIGPILAVPGITDALVATRARVVAVSPFVSGQALSGPAAALMATRGLAATPRGLAAAYAPWLDVLLADPADLGAVLHDCGTGAQLADIGVTVIPADVVMRDGAGEAALARAVLEAGPRGRRADGWL